MKRIFLTFFLINQVTNQANFTEFINGPRLHLEAASTEIEQVKQDARHDATLHCPLPSFKEQEEMKMQTGKIAWNALFGGVIGGTGAFFSQLNYPHKEHIPVIGVLVGAAAAGILAYFQEKERQIFVTPRYEKALKKAEESRSFAIEKEYQKILPDYFLTRGKMNTELQYYLNSFTQDDFKNLDIISQHKNEMVRLPFDLIVENYLERYPLHTFYTSDEALIKKLEALEKHLDFILQNHDRLSCAIQNTLYQLQQDVKILKNNAKLALFSIKTSDHFQTEEERIARDKKREEERRLYEAQLKKERELARAAQAQTTAAYERARRERAERERARAEQNKANTQTLQTWVTILGDKG